MAWLRDIRSRKDRGNIPPDQRLREQLYKWKVFQCVILVLNLAATAFLTGYIDSHNLGLAGALPVCIIMVWDGSVLSLRLVSYASETNMGSRLASRCWLL